MLAISRGMGQKRESRGKMLTKTKEKKDKVNELLQRKKFSFHPFLSQKSFCLSSVFLFFVFFPRFPLEKYFFSDVAQRKRKRCSEDCKIKLCPVCNCNVSLPLSQNVGKYPEHEIERHAFSGRKIMDLWRSQNRLSQEDVNSKESLLQTWLTSQYVWPEPSSLGFSSNRRYKPYIVKPTWHFFNNSSSSDSHNVVTDTVKTSKHLTLL